MKRLFALFAIIAIAPAGCTNPYVAEMDAIWAQHEQETRRIQTEYEAASTRIAEESKACLAAISALKVGSGEEITQSLPCKEDTINTTETGQTTSDQWVYRTPVGDAYLYFRNARLVAKQL
jgi:hypothetical protein